MLSAQQIQNVFTHGSQLLFRSSPKLAAGPVVYARSCLRLHVGLLSAQAGLSRPIAVTFQRIKTASFSLATAPLVHDGHARDYDGILLIGTSHYTRYVAVLALRKPVIEQRRQVSPSLFKTCHLRAFDFDLRSKHFPCLLQESSRLFPFHDHPQLQI